MSFCGYCGSQMPDDMRFCTNCGKPLAVKDTQSADKVMDVSDPKPFYDNAADDFSDLEQDPYNNWNNVSSSDSESLYQTLKDNAERSEILEKKKNIVPLVLTLICAVAAVVLVIVVINPFDKLNDNADNAPGDVADGLPIDEVKQETEDAQTPEAGPSGTSSSNSTSSKPQNEVAKDPEIVDAGGCFKPINQFSDYVTYDFYYDIYNPNSSFIVQSPEITLNMRSYSGTILATDTESVGLIMPGDTVRIFGSLSVLKSEIDQVSDGDELLSWRNVSKDSGFYNPIYSADVVFSKVSARSSSYSGSVTGEITNNSDYDITLSQIYAIFKKGDEIIMISDGFTDGIPSGQTRVFEINTFDEIPDYDTIEMYIEPW